MSVFVCPICKATTTRANVHILKEGAYLTFIALVFALCYYRVI